MATRGMSDCATRIVPMSKSLLAKPSMGRCYLRDPNCQVHQPDKMIRDSLNVNPQRLTPHYTLLTAVLLKSTQLFLAGVCRYTRLRSLSIYLQRKEISMGMKASTDEGSHINKRSPNRLQKIGLSGSHHIKHVICTMSPEPSNIWHVS